MSICPFVWNDFLEFKVYLPARWIPLKCMMPFINSKHCKVRVYQSLTFLIKVWGSRLANVCYFFCLILRNLGGPPVGYWYMPREGFQLCEIITFNCQVFFLSKCQKHRCCHCIHYTWIILFVQYHLCCWLSTKTFVRTSGHKTSFFSSNF